MKKILGLDLGSTSIGWALVNEAENESERSSIIKLGVRVIPLTTDEQGNFEKGKAITTNQDRTSKRSARRNLHRYKLRRKELLKVLEQSGLITKDSILTEEGANSTFQTLELRAKAAVERIEKDEFARVLISINKKRGYKSSRKAKNEDEGQLIDGMKVAMDLHKRNITPGQFALEIFRQGKRFLPDFYRSDLQKEFDQIWRVQSGFYPEILSESLKNQLIGKNQKAVWAICEKPFGIVGAKRNTSGFERKLENYQWRAEATQKQVSLEQLIVVLQEINAQVNSSSGYLGSISDRSKELYFNSQTVGQYLFDQIKVDRHKRLKGQVFYRKDYENEFDIIWNSQSRYHSELNDELRETLKDIVIFYQRRLKSQKGLISVCELEGRETEVIVDGKKKSKLIGPKVSPKSSPLFQEFRVWQRLNDLEVISKKDRAKRRLEPDEKQILFEELTVKEKLSKVDALKLLFKNHKELDLNFEKLDGNRTSFKLFEAYQKIIVASGHDDFDFSKMSSKEIKSIVTLIFEGLGIDTGILSFNSNLESDEFERQPYLQLWHLLYSYEGDNSATGNESLIKKLKSKFGFEEDYARILSAVTFEDDYGSLSSKAISKILPHLNDGLSYSDAALLAGYKSHSHSENEQERANKTLKEKLEILPKNSLRNPVVEKILNQTINVLNAIIDEYGKPDEIRLELARELKKSAKEREDLTKTMNSASIEHENIRRILKNEFGLTYVSRTDIIRYKLWKELEPRAFKTLYTNTYIAPEKLFSKEFDIEHIIPQSRLFDDSFSNKTLELRSANIEKGEKTAFDYVSEKFGEQGLREYEIRVEELYKRGSEGISKGKYKKLLMKGTEIPDGFVDRDLRNSQYIAKKAKELLEEVCRTVNTTTGSVTDRLREDWQLINVMQELNWEKYKKLGLTYYEANREGKNLPRIKDWTKRNDHRHHAMDALTVAFTKYNHVQYLNNLNARRDDGKKMSPVIKAIENKELYRDDSNKLKFKPPIPLDDFRAEAKWHLEETLVSFKAKNKVVTPQKNKIKGSQKIQNTLTPRGQLHNESIYGSIKRYKTTISKVGGSFNEETIAKISKKVYREALLKRLLEFGNDPKKAFTGKNSLEKNPIYLDKLQTRKVPEKVKLVEEETVYTVRKPIDPNLKLDKIIDEKVKKILEKRLQDFGGDPKKAFVNLDENPIWLNKEKGISIKNVTITGISNAVALHDKKDKFGNLILDKEGKTQPVDFVSTSNNHHVAIYRDSEGNLQENVVSFFEALARVNAGIPVIDKSFKRADGWEFLFSIKQNEYFVFPNSETGFDPQELDLKDDKNFHLVGPNLFRVQKIGSKDYVFRHHLETQLKDLSELEGVVFHRLRSTSRLSKLQKVRINHLGEIVEVGEY
ncbi:type II CRISPR RNA-guided endonuclease Cas9 [Mariniradius sediminis]|uniref:CRISPR-associated endonuclease Cas9 n=1 Tax=Mariniradius sediminis TaxID=2909237 RepID=A0ABS9BZ48_9BACT|nr:type II CRISPR RNA-guided endonuclease Cas9 [Mariniradius sediminis]MCF1752940.1 type II CRISPR RNA-guided endonuclease Cas9 [Mariniradius sediminis]